MKGVTKILGVAVLAAVFVFSGTAAAQNVTPNEPVEAKGVGVSGGIIAGAEVVLLIESFADVKPSWPWVVFPILGAGGGGVGGYFIEKNSPKGAVALLVSSMALLIPTTVAISIARAYEAEEEGAVPADSEGGAAFSFELNPSEQPDEGTYTEVESRPDSDSIPDDEPPIEEAPDSEPAPEPTEAGEGDLTEPEARNDSGGNTAVRHLASGSLFHVGSDRSFGFGIPAVDVRPTVWSPEESIHGITPGVEIHVPLFKVDLP